MARLGGLPLVKPTFDWGAKDKLTELEQFKADCHILFNGPLCDLKDKQCAGLLVNWLGREATQILASVESDVFHQRKCLVHLKRSSGQSLIKH